MADKVSAYRKAKYGAYFDFVDRNNQGFITTDNFFYNILALRDLGNLGNKALTALQKDMMSWWAMFKESAEKNGGKLTRDQFISDNVRYHSSEDGSEEVRKHYEAYFRYIDQNEDGEISVDELMLFYKSQNWTDEIAVREIFSRLDTNKDGRITIDEWTAAHIAYWRSDDPENGFDFLYKRATQ